VTVTKTTTTVVIPSDPDDLVCDTCPNRYPYKGNLLRTFEAARVRGWHIYQHIQTRYTQSTGEMINVVNKHSQNLHAELLLRLLGRERGPEGLASDEAGVVVVTSFLIRIGAFQEGARLQEDQSLTI